MLPTSCPGLAITASGAIVAEGPAAALQWLLDAVRANPLLGLGEMDGSATEHDLIRQLVSHPDFAADDLVIEFGNALYQDVPDAYISGEDIPFGRLGAGLEEYDAVSDQHLGRSDLCPAVSDRARGQPCWRPPTRAGR